MDILSEISQAGLVITLAGDQLKITNPSKLTDVLRGLIRTNRQEIIKGIMEQQENRGLMTGARVYCYRTTDNPKSVLTNIATESELSEVHESLKLRYGDRLIEVYPMPITKH